MKQRANIGTAIKMLRNVAGVKASQMASELAYQAPTCPRSKTTKSYDSRTTRDLCSTVRNTRLQNHSTRRAHVGEQGRIPEL